MLYVIGLGLGDAKDITVKGLEIVKRCERIYLEAYTSILTCGQEELVSVSQAVMYHLINAWYVLGKVLWEVNHRCRS
jgi:diphthamide biosynthesis methyltransferase